MGADKVKESIKDNSRFESILNSFYYELNKFNNTISLLNEKTQKLYYDPREESPSAPESGDDPRSRSIIVQLENNINILSNYNYQLERINKILDEAI